MQQHKLKMIWVQEWEFFPIAKIKKKTCFRWSVFMLYYISAYKAQIAIDLKLISQNECWIESNDG